MWARILLIQVSQLCKRVLTYELSVLWPPCYLSSSSGERDERLGRRKSEKITCKQAIMLYIGSQFFKCCIRARWPLTVLLKLFLTTERTHQVLHYACYPISFKVMVDDEIRNMPGNGDYPKFKETANKQKFILRFPKAANRILYDPGLEVGEADAGALVSKNLPYLSLALLALHFILF